MTAIEYIVAKLRCGKVVTGCHDDCQGDECLNSFLHNVMRFSIARGNIIDLWDLDFPFKLVSRLVEEVENVLVRIGDNNDLLQQLEMDAREVSLAWSMTMFSRYEFQTRAFLPVVMNRLLIIMRQLITMIPEGKYEYLRTNYTRKLKDLTDIYNKYILMLAFENMVVFVKLRREEKEKEKVKERHDDMGKDLTSAISDKESIDALLTVNDCTHGNELNTSGEELTPLQGSLAQKNTRYSIVPFEIEKKSIENREEHIFSRPWF